MSLDEQIERARRQVAQSPGNHQLGANLVRLLMQAGELNPQAVKYCSSLSDPVSRILFPKQPEMSVKEVLKEIGDKRFSVEFAIYCAEKVLPIFEAEFPEDDRPRLAIEAAKSWLKDPSEENRIAADAAAYAAYAADAADAADAAAAAYTAYAAAAAADAAAYTAWDAWAAAAAAAAATDDAARALGEETTDNQLLIEYLMLGDKNG